VTLAVGIFKWLQKLSLRLFELPQPKRLAATFKANSSTILTILSSFVLIYGLQKPRLLRMQKNIGVPSSKAHWALPVVVVIPEKLRFVPYSCNKRGFCSTTGAAFFRTTKNCGDKLYSPTLKMTLYHWPNWQHLPVLHDLIPQVVFDILGNGISVWHIAPQALTFIMTSLETRLAKYIAYVPQWLAAFSSENQRP